MSWKRAQASWGCQEGFQRQTGALQATRSPPGPPHAALERWAGGAGGAAGPGFSSQELAEQESARGALPAALQPASRGMVQEEAACWIRSAD